MPFITQGKTNLKYILIVVILAAIAGGGILGYYYLWIKDLETRLTVLEVKMPEKNTEIKECIMGVNIDYNSDMNVKNVSDVEFVFNKFIAHSKENNQEIFGHNPEFYKFKTATIHGTYQGKKYWKVTTEWYGNDQENKYAYGKWLPEEIFDVSENGKVVRLLGCI
jgi:hypothetical protein